MGEVTVNRAVLFGRIESALFRYAGLIDYLEKVSEYDCERTEDREILGLALASMELLRAEMHQDRGEWDASFEDLYLATAIFRGDFTPDPEMVEGQ